MTSKRPTSLSLLAILLIPLLLVLHVPVLAAVVPGALLTVASLGALDRDRAALAPAAEVVTIDDSADIRRIAAAIPIEARSRRVDARGA